MFPKTMRIIYLKTLARSPRFSLNTVKEAASQENPTKKTPRVKPIHQEYFIPTQKLEFENDGRCLLYYYVPRGYTYTFLYSRYLIPFGYIATLIKNNPWFLTFPASLPLMFIAELYLLKKLLDQKKIFRQVVAEIYLHKDGITLEVIFDNQLWRKFKKDDYENFFFIPSLKTPKQGGVMPPLMGELFPEVYPYNTDRPFGYAWTKYYRTPRNWFSLPKFNNYSNMEVLIAIFKGMPIDCSKKNIVEIDYSKKDKYKDI